ncbi:MAG: carboxypeptidase-like regulatory domain-containing protein, partial [Bryobacterales bacterium]|nr:carboxypeptidase-like regulatory domain-containing protein [Bryobacterales bacterium]
MVFSGLGRYSLLTLLAAGIGLAQQIDGRIQGQVLDPTGAVVEGVEIIAEQTDTGTVRRADSGPEGLYAIPALAPGAYTVSVSAEGFKTVQTGPIALAIGDRINADFVLEIGPASETVIVSASAWATEASDAAVGTVIPNRFVTSLPLNGRNFLHLSLLAPGSVPAAVGSPGSERGRFAFQANGARESANSFVYDGVYAIDPILNSFSIVPPVDAVREFRIQTSNSEAGLGRNSGGQVVVATKRGTNEWHGTAYEFLRNDRLDARNFFSRPDDPVPALRRNQYGASLGGPVAESGTFFFANFEGLRETRA